MFNDLFQGQLFIKSMTTLRHMLSNVHGIRFHQYKNKKRNFSR